MGRYPRPFHSLTNDMTPMTAENEQDNVPQDESGEKPKARGRGAARQAAALAATETPSHGSFIDNTIIRNVTKDVDERVRETQAALEAQPRVLFYVPLAPGENPKTLEFVSINGFSVEIRKGVTVAMPKQIVEMIIEKYKIEQAAGAEKRIDRDDKTTEALS